jgi:hypothetical protein
MAKNDLTVKDRERFLRARVRGTTRAHDPSALVGARYDARRDVLDLTFRGGGSMVIPSRLVPGLQRAAAADLDSPVVSPAGDALRWPALDLDVYVPGLVERAFGTRLFAAATGQKGGRRRSKAKAVAAKLNGAKGGRPCKRLSA